MSKFSYLGWVLGRRLAGQSRDCPYCGSRETRLNCRKKYVVELLQCGDCGLRFRWPKPEPQALADYYQEDYAREETTDLPDDAALKALTHSGFEGAGINDMSERIAQLKAQRPSGKTLDYGCSWGYGTWQLRAAGYDVTGFEISRSRAGYGRDRLDLDILDDPAALDGMDDASLDIVFTSHVMEHLPDPKDPFRLFSPAAETGRPADRLRPQRRRRFRPRPRLRLGAADRPRPRAGAGRAFLRRAPAGIRFLDAALQHRSLRQAVP